MLVLEAMKMETEVVAEKNIKISQILVAIGDKVAQGQLLIEYTQEN